ncbi:hypothetical protein M2277_005054 [Paenibacillus sp. LBL]|uniref:hypothetical protein n=1 Tax=Paenibacillus sp. LBL TaxID=2940563 RepID=UPI0024764B55|nr:hypothetical protein [Paenibacillus sp. LBL]MDH6674362.1 hypothetical protein [Paenibacillus sp. LBL]
MMTWAGRLLRFGIFASILLTTLTYSEWGWGSILAGIGLLAIISFISYLMSRGRDLDEREIPSVAPNGPINLGGDKWEKMGFDIGKEAIKYCKSELKPNEAISQETYSKELLYLTTFGIDFAALSVLGDSTVKNKIMNYYYVGCSSIRFDLARCTETQKEYAELLKKGPPQKELGIYYNIGKAFAYRCTDNTVDPVLILSAVQHLTTTINKFTELFEVVAKERESNEIEAL